MLTTARNMTFVATLEAERLSTLASDRFDCLKLFSFNYHLTIGVDAPLDINVCFGK
jgi:hypothetical protein